MTRPYLLLEVRPFQVETLRGLIPGALPPAIKFHAFSVRRFRIREASRYQLVGAALCGRPPSAHPHLFGVV